MQLRHREHRQPTALGEQGKQDNSVGPGKWRDRDSLPVDDLLRQRSQPGPVRGQPGQDRVTPLIISR